MDLVFLKLGQVANTKDLLQSRQGLDISLFSCSH